MANREKDREICTALLDRNLVDRKILRTRVNKIRGIAPEEKQHLLQTIAVPDTHH
jgi:hypothetical protein